jgi:hypothetical protein
MHWGVAAAGALLLASIGIALGTRRADGCATYTRVDVPLIAHAGGGLPARTYANDVEALDLAARHGFTMIEIDFIERRGKLTIGHDDMPESAMTPADLMRWLNRHPAVSIVTDVKSDNRRGLTMIKALAGARISRFIPQIYSPSEFGFVRALGFPAPILTVYRLGDSGWQSAANSLPLRAVTIPYERRDLASGIRHPIFLHTVNQPMEGFGLYTDCLIPG